MPDFIYPRDFFQSQKEAQEQGLCFVLMPFAEEYRQIYDGVLKPTVEECGLKCLRADDIYSPRPILVTVMEHISKAELVIADLSGRNPNVFYEVAMAHIVKPNERVVLSSRTTEDVPFDLRHLRLIIYNDSPEGLEKFKIDLRKALKSLGLAEPPEGAVTPSGEEEAAGNSHNAESAPFVQWEWSRVTVSFLLSQEEWPAFRGRVTAGLLEWFDFGDIDSKTWKTINFPGGKIAMPWSSPELVVPRDQPVALDELARVVGLPYEAVSYQIDAPFEPAAFARHLKHLNLPISYASNSQITVVADPKLGSGFVDLAQDGDHMILKVRAAEGLPYQVSRGVVAFDDIRAFLTGAIAPKAFAQALVNFLSR